MERFHLLLIIVLVPLFQAYTSTCCTQKERYGLLQLKAYFMSTASTVDDQLSVETQIGSWGDHGNKNCCLWENLKCDKHMQHVVALSLSWVMPQENHTNVLNLTLFQPFGKLRSLDLSQNHIQRLVGSEVLENLEQLQELYLRDNNMNGSMQALANLKHLRELDLSDNYFHGSISEGLCNMKNLQRLQLANNNFSGSLPKCLGQLTFLQFLDLANNNLSREVPSSIVSNLTSLTHLSLPQNHFQGNFSLTSLLYHSKLEVLVLSYSGLQVKIDDALLPITFQPKVLGLSHCSLYLQSRAFLQFLLHQHRLLFLDISHNGLVGSFPTSLLLNNSAIQTAILRNNSFEDIHKLPANAKIHSLLHFDISKNNISGPFPEDIILSMPSLEYFNASKNSFQGEIPASIGNMTALRYLDLSNNNLSGEVPSNMYTKCTALETLILSSNSLEGDIIPKYLNLTMLSWLYLDNNNFSGAIQPSLLRSATTLGILDLSNNKLVGGIPSWMGNLSGLFMLSMSNNNLQGHIPTELWNLQELKVLDLSDNGLIGVIPSSCNLSSMNVLSLRNNFLTGPLPSALSRSSQLLILDLSQNRFSGYIPRWISDLSQLNVLLLGKNLLEGELPLHLCRLLDINMMDFSSNNISGVIPSCFANMSFGSTSIVFDISSEDFSGLLIGLPSVEYIDDLIPAIHVEVIPKEEVKFLTKSRYDRYQGYILDHMSGLDLSCNQLTGVIPQELGHLGTLRALNLSHNQLSGSIPSSFSTLRSLESLDLSYNKLSGAIPNQLVDDTALGTFSVAYNNLSGEVPETGQFASFDDGSYKGNPLLCGSLLEHKCTPDKNDTKQGVVDIGTGFDWVVFSWSFGTSSVTIFFASIAALWINPYWSRAWFRFIDYHVLWWLNLPS